MLALLSPALFFVKGYGHLFMVAEWCVPLTNIMICDGEREIFVLAPGVRLFGFGSFSGKLVAAF